MQQQDVKLAMKVAAAARVTSLRNMKATLNRSIGLATKKAVDRFRI
jgi:uncharacterized protein YqeY